MAPASTTFAGTIWKSTTSRLFRITAWHPNKCTNYSRAGETVVANSPKRDTILWGSLERVGRVLEPLLETEGTICFCPLLITEQALNRLQSVMARLPGKFSRTRVLPGAILGR